MSIEFEINRLGYLAAPLMEIVTHARTLSGSDFIKGEKIWTMEPNFVALEICADKCCHARFSLYGLPDQFDERPIAELKPSRGCYSTVVFDRKPQKNIVISYLDQAWRNKELKTFDPGKTGNRILLAMDPRVQRQKEWRRSRRKPESR